jgi:sec-independent protein translocase protein TatA
MFGLGPAELLIIGVFALLFIGPKKLPELARGLGKSLREFQRAKNDLQHEIDQEVDEIKGINNPTVAKYDDPTLHHDEESDAVNIESGMSTENVDEKKKDEKLS